MMGNLVRNIKCLSLGLTLLTIGCGGDDKHAINLPIGEECKSTDECETGLTCYNNKCRQGCTSNSDCEKTDYCNTTNHVCLTYSNGCQDGWTGNNCKECAAGYYGSECAKCPDCGVHGQCDEGLNGQGTCKCDNGWEGDVCQTKSACPEGFIGEECDKCADGYYGQNCKPCTCKHGTCFDGANGDGYCRDETCDVGFTGRNCDKCADGYYGPECKLPTCVNGTIDPANGECASCNSNNFTGNNCDQCAKGFTGENCDKCAEGYYGPECRLPTCVNGTIDPTNGECASCNDVHFTGANCDKCAEGFTGEKCDQCMEGTYGKDCKFYGSVMDPEGKIYKTVIIDGLEWMAENLSREIGNFYYPDNNSDNKDRFGLLYDWKTANDNICPEGWRLPKMEDFDSLIKFVQPSVEEVTGEYVELISFDTMFSLIDNTSDWNMSKEFKEFTTQDPNIYGFGALPAGNYYGESCINFGDYAIFWTSSGADEYAYDFFLGEGYANIGFNNKANGYSVRCIKGSN